jgi:hypothetical protein
VALYRHYGHVEAPGKSTLFAEISKAVARDPVSIAFLAEMAPAKWQPNLLIAAVRYLYGTPPDARRFIERVHAHPDEIAAVMATRSTQTNEPARCATLLPLLAQLPQPLALLEVGASAGLCLWPDHYQYVYGRHRVRARVSPTEGEAPTFHCSADAATPLPRANVEVVWRAGLDLHPVDLDDAAEMRWLEALVWPGQLERLEGLRAASAVARQHPSPVIRGDLRRDLTDLAKLAPAGATLVIFHSAVLAYLEDPEQRAAFAHTVAGLDATWIANERPRYIPGVPAELEDGSATEFLLARDGQPVAWTDGHGAAIRWGAGDAQRGPRLR